MGCSTTVACRDCKKSWYCGYGSYGSHLERGTKAPFEDHAGHEVVTFGDDITSTNKDGALCIDGQRESEVWIPDYAQFERIDISGDPNFPRRPDRIAEFYPPYRSDKA